MYSICIYAVCIVYVYMVIVVVLVCSVCSITSPNPISLLTLSLSLSHSNPLSCQDVSELSGARGIGAAAHDPSAAEGGR